MDAVIEKPVAAHGVPGPDGAAKSSWEGSALDAMTRDEYQQIKRFLRRRHRSQLGLVAFKDIDRFISSVGDLRLHWDALLRIAERRHAAETHLWDAGYWMDSAHKEGLAFVALDKSLLVSRGLYKTALARRSLESRDCDTLYGVKVSRWSVDWEMYRLWRALRELCREQEPRLRIVPNRQCVSATTQGSWQVEEFFLTLCRQDRVTGESTTLTLPDCREWLEQMAQAKSAPPPRRGGGFWSGLVA
jgi:hypothetical protein